MIPNPIRKVLSLIEKHQVKALLMGGQACVLYGAAEFSRDVDLLLLVNSDNLKSFGQLLKELQAEQIAVPPFEISFLEKGHAVHFRCQHPEATGLRIDIMSQLRGVDSFERLWERRTTVVDDGGATWDVLSLPDLVLAKKTQRDKDWPMIQRLLEANYFAHQDSPQPNQPRFWLLELRTAELLIELSARYHELATELTSVRSLLATARQGNRDGLEMALAEEVLKEKQVDREHWKMLKKELEQLRHKAKR